MNIYVELEKRVLPLMTDYQTDLTKHDKADIERHGNTPFIHYHGDTGTSILFLIPENKYPRAFERVPYLFATADRRHILDQLMVMVQYHNKERYYAKRVHYFDGSKLREIDHKKAIEIAAAYTRKILNTWRKEKVS